MLLETLGQVIYVFYSNKRKKQVFEMCKQAYLVLNVGLLVFVEMNLEESGSVELDPDTLANDLGGVDEVIEDRVVNGDQGAGPRRKC